MTVTEQDNREGHRNAEAESAEGETCVVVGQTAICGPDEEVQRVDPERVGTEREKLTVVIPKREVEILRRIAAKRDMSLTDIVRRAIAMEEFIEEINQKGGKLLVEQPNRTMRELVLR